MPEQHQAVTVTSTSSAVRELLATMTEPRTLRLWGKCLSVSYASGVVARRVPALGLPVVLLAGVYIGLEMAAYIADNDALGRAIDARVIDVITVGGDAHADCA